MATRKSGDPSARILSVVHKRLARDPRDTDALFAKAAALATAQDLVGALEALETLAKVDDAYPGLWVLKAKLHTQRGEFGKARESRERGKEVEHRQEGIPPPPEPDFQCPICHAAADEKETSCRFCGASFREGEPPAPRSAVPRPKAPLESPRGLTNGLARMTAPHGTGHTNGLVRTTPPQGTGHTNGLVRTTPPKGTGHTNGLVRTTPPQGTGHTNGLVRTTPPQGTGHTNGLVRTTPPQGTGHTNGLVMGIQSLRWGLTNGLTNGSGFTSGLGSGRVGHEARVHRWRLYVIPLLAAALLLLPLFGPIELGGPYPIAIDGNLGDWDVRSLAAQPAGPGLNPNVDILRFGAVDNVDFVAFAVEVGGTALGGGGNPPTTDRFTVLLDTDRNASTGYHVDGFGADRRIEVAGWGGGINHSALYEWDWNRDPRDWRGWIKETSVPSAASGPRLEMQVRWSALKVEKGPVFALLQARGHDGTVDTSDFAVSPIGGSLVVRQESVVPETISGPSVELLRLEVTAFRAQVQMEGITVTLSGSADPGDVGALRLLDGGGALVADRVPVDRRVEFAFDARPIEPGSPQEFLLIAMTSSANGETLGARIAGSADVVSGTAPVTVTRTPSAREVGYLGAISTAPRVDGGYAEWRSVPADPVGDVINGPDSEIDLYGFAAQSEDNTSFFHLRVGGKMFAGTWVPEHNAIAFSRTVPVSDQDRDTVPDALDLFPSDFDNDGVPDSATGGDYDRDGALDYGQAGGTDLWLNTTIPGSFPAPYAGTPVSVYIGPRERPFQAPDDILRVFVDVDNESGTGYAEGGLGAERMIEISGTGGVVRTSGVYAFDGSYPGAWAWRWTGDISSALGFDRIEFRTLENVTRAGARLYVEMGGALGSRDTMDGGTRGTRGVREAPDPGGVSTPPFETPFMPMPEGEPWGVLPAGTRGSTLVDGSSNAVTTQYNHQRKVVRAGDVAGDGPCDATNSDGCWYAAFYDQLSEENSTGASTETITTGSRIGGAFPTDIETDNGVFINYTEGDDPTRAEIGYRSATTSGVNFPKTRSWDGSAWGAEVEQATAGSPLRAVRIAWSYTSPGTRIMVTQSDDGFLDAYVCTPSCTVTNNIGQTWSTAPTSAQKRFDVAYESLSGDAILVYHKEAGTGAQDIAYKTFVGGSWSAEQYLDDTGHAGHATYAIIDLASWKGSNQVGLVGGDSTNSDVNAWIWDGSAWASPTSITDLARTPDRGEAAIAWETNSGHLLAVAVPSGNADSILSKEYTTTWSAATADFLCAVSGTALRWLSLKPNPLSTANDMVIATLATTNNVNTCYWTGGAWANFNTHDAAGDDSTRRVVDFAWEDSGSKGLLVYGTTAGQITYRTYTAPNAFGAITNVAMGANVHPWVQLRTNPTTQAGSMKILGAVMEDTANDLGGIRWDGTTFTVIGASTFTADVGTASWESFELEYQAKADDGLLVTYDWTGVPAGDSYTLRVKGYRDNEDVAVQILTPPSAWTTRITISATTSTSYQYTLTSAEYNGGTPSVRFNDTSVDGLQSNLFLDLSVIATTSLWDRVILMRSSDTGGSTWGAQVILASGRAADSALVLARDSAEPSIAIDSGGFLHVVWASALAVGNQPTMNLVRYTKTTVAYPTQAEVANAANWEAITSVDDTRPGYMPTVSTDTSNSPHIAWSASKSTSTVEAAIAYRSTTTSGVNFPKTRTWDGSAWGGETEQSTAGSPVRAVRSAWSPAAVNERILVTLSDDGWLDAYVCTPTCTVTNNLGQVWSAAPAEDTKRFDVAYEQASGDALLAYSVLSTDTTRDLAYRTYVGGVWSAEQYLDDTGHATDVQYGALKVASRAGSNQIGLVAKDNTNNDANAWIWDGTAFGNFVELTAAAPSGATQEPVAIAWESNSGHLIAASRDSGTGAVVSKEFTTMWSGASSSTCGASTAYWLSLKPNPMGDDMIMVAARDSAAFDLGTCYWTGGAWANAMTHDTATDGGFNRPADFAWEATGSKGLLVWGTTAGQITYRTYTAPNTWGAITNAAMGVNTHPWVQLRTNPYPRSGGTKILGAVLEATANDLGAIRWDGTTFTVVGASTFTAAVGTSSYESFELEYRDSGTVSYKNKAGGAWKPTVTWGTTYTGLSVDVSPANDYVSLARYFEAATNEVQYTVCKDLSTSNCDAAAEFTKADGTAGVDAVATAVEAASYPSLATTYESNGDLWVAHAKDIDGTTRAIYARFLDYPGATWAAAETVDSLSGTIFTRPSIGIDKDNDVHALYVATATPQLYYNKRTGGIWGIRSAVDTTSDNPTLMVRAPNNATYGSDAGGLYWKTSSSETYFFFQAIGIPEFEAVAVPILGILVLVLWRRRTHGTGRNNRASDLPESNSGPLRDS